jgi:hypothetical protein
MSNDQTDVFYPKFIPNGIWDILPEYSLSYEAVIGAGMCVGPFMHSIITH